MFMPLFALKFIEVQGLAESTLGDDITAVAKAAGVQVQADKEPDQNRFIRSDQYSFIRNGVPALAFKFGYEFGTPEDKIFHDWIRDRYHKPSDDLDQPVDKAAAAQFDHIIADLLEKVADAPSRPTWKDNSFFKRFQ
jgi:Zn-dependent M28 family amino/carboxypeptidase